MSCRMRAVSCALGIAVLATGTVRAQQNPEIETAGDLLVELDAGDETAGTNAWANTATESIGDFLEVGDPVVEDIEGMPAVTFNATDVLDAYQSEFAAPAGLVGLDPTRSIEAWVYNPAVPNEETIVAWGQRGGPAGTNMSFNYGTSPDFGAVGHWADPDLGWTDAGEAPPAGQWHHLVYTFDGTTTRVYADGELSNSEEVGAGVIDTYPDTFITLAAQIEADGITLNFDLRGQLSIGRLRIHDGVLSDEQVQSNFDVECEEFCPPPGTCECENCPEGTDQTFRTKSEYVRRLDTSGFPLPLTLTVTEPAGAEIDAEGVLRYPIPDPPPASFDVTVECTNDAGGTEFSWTVNLVEPPERADIEIAEELIVDLDALHESSGGPVWLNNGTLADFEEVGDPLVLDALGTPGVSFNESGTDDGYRSFENAPPGVVGIDPTRTIEVWAFNPSIADEETLVAWGYRGGPAGTNMSFNYGLNAAWGAVGHWGAPDIGWTDAGEAPFAEEWHHLAYTFDGTTTRVYADGVLSNSEELGAGVINTHTGTPITLAVQLTDAMGGLDFGGGREGTLAIGQVRVHDGVLNASQILDNFEAERERYGVPPPPVIPPEFVNAPVEDFFCAGETEYSFNLEVTGTPPPELRVVSPKGASITPEGLLTVPLEPDQEDFEIEVEAENIGDVGSVAWLVLRQEVSDALQIAGDLFVELDASDETAGTQVWTNNGTLDDFVSFGAPTAVRRLGIPAVSFNEQGRTGDVYQSMGPAPEGLVGLDPTRTIEVWAYNPDIANEETLVAWGQRGGPDGTNMSFNYGTNPDFGAVGHWGAGPDLGWSGAPEAGTWHHLVYTYDGTTTRVYADGELKASEELGAGVIETTAGTPITIAAQIEPDGVTLNQDLEGTLALARIRVHDGVLTPCQVQSNYRLEQGDFSAECPEEGDPDYADTHCLGIQTEETGISQVTVTADAEDETGDSILYTFTADDGTAEPLVMGPQPQNTATFGLLGRDIENTVFTVEVDDRLDCDDVADDAVCSTGDGGDDEPLFVRGDADASGEINITDGIFILNFLFTGGANPVCEDAADADDSNAVNITDGIFVLNFLFTGGGDPAAPWPDCGVDPDADETVSCAETHTGCQ